MFIFKQIIGFHINIKPMLSVRSLLELSLLLDIKFEECKLKGVKNSHLFKDTENINPNYCRFSVIQQIQYCLKAINLVTWS